MKSIKFLILFLFTSSSFAATQYVSDDLAIFMHSGPSREYRIIGSINVGTPVSTLEYNEQTKFMKVKSPRGRTGWVKASEIQKQPPAKSLLPEVQKKLQASQEQLNNINAKNKQNLSDKEQAILDKDNLIDQLEAEKLALRNEIEDLKVRNKELDILQDTKDERVKMEWLMYGGSVLFFGIVVGLIVPFLPRRKRSHDNW